MFTSIRRRPSIKAMILGELNRGMGITIIMHYLQDHSPPGTGAANKIEIIARLGTIGKGWSTVAFALRVLLEHQSVHHLLDDKQLRKSTNTASICCYLLATSIAETQRHIYLVQVASTVVHQTKTWLRRKESMAMACGMTPCHALVEFFTRKKI